MRSFWLKFWLFMASIALFASGWIFLLFNHTDHLDVFVPGEAEIYLNMHSSLPGKLSAAEQATFNAWLAGKSSLTAKQWQTLLRDLRVEIGLFSINGQVFGLTKKTKLSQNILARAAIVPTEKNGLYYFPSINLSENYLKNETWYAGIKKKFNFQPVNIYFTNQLALSYIIPMVAGEANEPFSVLADISKAGIKLKISGAAGQDNQSRLKSQIKSFPSDTRLYIHGLSTEDFNQKAAFTKENFNFHLLKSINGSVEYLETAKGFILFINKSNNPAEAVKKNILAIMAQTLPTKKPKLLPDETVAIQFIADPTAWKFAEGIDNGQIVQTLKEPKLDLNLMMREEKNFISITNNADQLFNGQTVNLRPAINKCDHWFKNGEILVKLDKNSPVTSYFSRLVLINKGKNKVLICLN